MEQLIPRGWSIGELNRYFAAVRSALWDCSRRGECFYGRDADAEIMRTPMRYSSSTFWGLMCVSAAQVRQCTPQRLENNFSDTMEIAREKISFGTNSADPQKLRRYQLENREITEKLHESPHWARQYPGEHETEILRKHQHWCSPAAIRSGCLKTRVHIQFAFS